MVERGFPMAYAQTKQRAHELIERMAPGQIFAVVTVMETMLDPVDRAIANAPLEDEEISEEETRAVAASKAWMAEHPGQGIAFEELLSEFGVTVEELRHSQDAA